MAWYKLGCCWNCQHYVEQCFGYGVYPRNIPTQVHPLGSARFAVSFVPLEGLDHSINITFNKELVPGAPFNAKIHTGTKNTDKISGVRIGPNNV